MQTLRKLQVVQMRRGFEDLKIANLVPSPTRSLRDLNVVAVERETWLAARADITELVEVSEELILGWGLGGLSGSAGAHFVEQRQWVMGQVSASGKKFWMMGGEPRHPSRWHQYLSDRYDRTAGGDIEERIMERLLGSVD